MGTLEFVEENGRYFIKNTIYLGDRDDVRGWEFFPEDWKKIKKKYDDIRSIRPHIDDLPDSQVEIDDRFDQMKKALAQIEFLNGYWLTSEESEWFHDMIRGGLNRFANKDGEKGETCFFGSFPGMQVATLMADKGFYPLAVY